MLNPTVYVPSILDVFLGRRCRKIFILLFLTFAAPLPILFFLEVVPTLFIERGHEGELRTVEHPEAEHEVGLEPVGVLLGLSWGRGEADAVISSTTTPEIYQRRHQYLNREQSKPCDILVIVRNEVPYLLCDARNLVWFTPILNLIRSNVDYNSQHVSIVSECLNCKPDLLVREAFQTLRI